MYSDRYLRLLNGYTNGQYDGQVELVCISADNSHAFAQRMEDCTRLNIPRSRFLVHEIPADELMRFDI